jgi:uncharacterized cupin superfamily protein
METDLPGVYLSRIDTDRWEPDADVGGVAHILFEEGTSTFGLWRSDPAHPSLPGEVEIPARETIVVLQGSVRVGLDGRSTLALAEGDIASLPKGSRVSWDPSPECRVLWSYS